MIEYVVESIKTEPMYFEDADEAVEYAVAIFLEYDPAFGVTIEAVDTISTEHIARTTVSIEEMQELRDEAIEAKDNSQVSMCDDAITGDEESIIGCYKIIVSNMLE